MITNRLLTLEKRTAELKSLERARGIRARVYNNADIVLTTGANAALTFNSERYDTDTIHSTSVNTSRLTMPFAGWYYVWGCVQFAANATGFRQLSIVVNNATTVAVQNALNIGAAAVVRIVVDTIYEFAAGDYVELFASQNSGGNLNAVSVGNLSPEFLIERLID